MRTLSRRHTERFIRGTSFPAQNKPEVLLSAVPSGGTASTWNQDVLSDLQSTGAQSQQAALQGHRTALGAILHPGWGEDLHTCSQAQLGGDGDQLGYHD